MESRKTMLEYIQRLDFHDLITFDDAVKFGRMQLQLKIS